MSMLVTLLASLLRIGGALGGVMAVYLIPDAMLLEALTAAGLAEQVPIPMARMAAHAICGVAGFVIVSQIAGLLLRAPRLAPGTREDAAAAVPRLRRHLVEGGAAPGASSLPDYLDPDPAPTKPVGVSFKELGLEQPHVSEYPAPGGDSAEVSSDEFAYREECDRPDSAGSASDEWDDPEPSAPRAMPESAPEPAKVTPVQGKRDEAHPAEVQLAHMPPYPDAADIFGDSPLDPEMLAEAASPIEPEIERQDPMPPDLPQENDLPQQDRSPSSSPDVHQAETGAEALRPEEPCGEDPAADDVEIATPASAIPEAEPAPAVRLAETAPVAESIDPATIAGQYAAPAPAQAEAAEPAAQPVHDDFSKPSFAMPAADGGADWYDGAGDDDEDADDDGAGYGSLADIGLGKNHVPQAAVGQRGEAGLPPALYSSGGVATLPKGKPQDFRMREALAELQRLEASIR